MSEVLFSEWIKDQLNERTGWTAGTLAENTGSGGLGISRAAAYFYVTGARVPNERALGLIATALKIERSSMPSFIPRRTAPPQTKAA